MNKVILVIVMDLTRRGNTCEAHVSDPSRQYDVMFTTTWAPDLELEEFHPTWDRLQIRINRRNRWRCDSDRFDFSSLMSSINTCDLS
jgi:hypothetical protein